MDEELRTEVEAWIRSQIIAGFCALDDIVEGARDVYFHGEGAPEFDEEIESQCRAMANKCLEELLQEQKSWVGPTDNDRLESAFDDLENQGIIAMMNWTCCQTCGHYEIGEPIEEAKESGLNVIGYTFFHQQDTDAAVEGHGLMFAYGALEEKNDLEVPKKVVATLERHGFKVSWDGTTSQRIAIPEFNWRRRWEQN
jgi:hypothetical protein